ncbi:hypothetical protein FOZ63_013865, partial [Perkinsus olseni]
ATAEVISAEETTTISRQKKMKSQTIRCRLADKSLYDMIVKKRPDMRGKDGCLVRGRSSVKVAAEDTIESRVRRSSRHQRGTRLTPSELAKIIQASQLKDTSAYGRYYNEQRLREEGGGPPEPPPTPVSPEPIKAFGAFVFWMGERQLNGC